MAGEGECLFRVEHPRFAPERGFGLLIVQPGVAARDHQHDALIDAQRQRLGDLPRRHPERRCGLDDGCGALFGFDDRQVGCALGQVVPDRFIAHGGQIGQADRNANAVPVTSFRS